MDIVIHGTKGGRKIFTPKKIGGLIDVTADRCLTSAIGQEAFAIRFIENSIIFSKYKIIRDVSGAKRIGFLAFSIFLSIFEKLSGADIINALNKLSNEYCKRYIPDNDDNLDEVKEDWTFLDLISDDYKNKIINLPSDDIQKMLSGTKDDGYIYYINVEELQNYFNFPHQDIYSKFRQVLFVNVELKDKEQNPLNALRHSEENLTGKIDLDNPKYKLLFKQNYNDGARIEVKVNGIPQISSYRMNRKDELAIKWFKNYFESKEIKGRLGEISDHYIEINHNSATVVIKEILLSEEKKVINVTVKDWKGNKLDNVIVSCKNGDLEKNLNENNQIIFTGYDLSKQWFIDAKKDRIFSEPQTIDFEKSFIEIVLNKHKINITAHNDSIDGDVIQEFKVSKQEFSGDELEKVHEISVSSKDYEPYTFDYHPLNSEIKKHIVLKRKQNRNTKTTDLVHPGDHEKLRDNNDYSSKQTKEREDKNKKLSDISKRGKKIYEKRGFIAGVISIVFLLIVGCILYFLEILITPPPPTPITPDTSSPITTTYYINDSQITKYINGKEFLIDTLYYYRNNYSGDKIIILDSAIKMRLFLDSKNIKMLKQYIFFGQDNFLKKFKSIDDRDSVKVKNQLGSISSLTLEEIGNKLDTILKDKNSTLQPNHKTVSPTQGTKRDNISSQLRNDKFTRENLKDFIKNNPTDKSGELYKTFWDFIDNNFTPDNCRELLAKVKISEGLKNSALKEFLQKICNDTKQFQILKSTRGISNKQSIAELNELINTER